jgi:lipid-binding SYLF domain-containing protein
MQRLITLLAVTLMLVFGSAASRADEKTDKRLEASRHVLETFTGISEQAIPGWLLERAYGIVVAPSVFEMAVIGGGRGGKGVMAVRNPDGSWSNPVFLTLYGGSIGFQWGMQTTDMVLVLMSRKSVEGISGGKFTLGFDASVAAGPVGRTASADTDATFKAQVLSYSRSQGVFLGVSFEGSVISVDDDADATAYGVPDILASQILEGKVGTPPPAAREFTAALARATASTAAADQGAAPAAAPAAPQPATAPAATPASPAGEPKSGSPAQTYPMEDPKPGAPPPS